jgi:Protein of unknown function (DUF3047)
MRHKMNLKQILAYWSVRFFSVCLALLLAACAVTQPHGAESSAGATNTPSTVADTPPQAWNNAWSQASVAMPDKPASAWHHQTLPGKTPTLYAYERKDGRDTVAVKSVFAASLLRKNVHIPASELDRLRFSWKVPELIANADLAQRDTADSPARIVLAFEGDRSKFSAKNSMLSELARILTGEPMPYATLMYVWCNTRSPGSVIVSPRTDRIRKIVVESGGKNLNQWLDYERNIRADFEQAFGEAPGALVGIGIMTDTDNTHSQTSAWYGKLTLARKLADR